MVVGFLSDFGPIWRSIVCCGFGCVLACVRVCFVGGVPSSVGMCRMGQWMGVEMENGEDSDGSPVLLGGGSSAQSSTSD